MRGRCGKREEKKVWSRGEGLAEGIEQESGRYSKLVCPLLAEHREQDLERAAKGAEYREHLYEELHIYEPFI